MYRRRLLAVLAAAGSAGCFGTEDGADGSEGPDRPPGTAALQTSPGSLPGYTRWLPASTIEPSVVRLDFARVNELDSYSVSADDKLSVQGVSGLVEAYPAATATAALALLAALRERYPFLNSVSYRGATQPDSTPIITADSLMLAGDGLILSGRLDEQALQSTDSAARLDTDAGYTVYGAASPESDVDPATNPFATDGRNLIFPLAETGNGATMAERRQTTLDDVLETRAAGISTGLPGLEWLLARCGDGALVLAGAGQQFTRLATTDASRAETDPTAFGLDRRTAEEFETLFEENDGSAAVMVVDDHDGGRVTRSGFAFGNGDSVPDSRRFGDLVARGASDRTVVTEDNRLVVEAFWS
jgi:hypothetical protein